MSPRRTAMVALICLAAGFVPAQVAAICPAPPAHDDVLHTEGVPCADPDRDGDACGAGCPCTCCPGHGSAPVFTVERLGGQILTTALRIGLLSDSPSPRDIHLGIFHPPRA
ncbi:MAG: hypothetical protein Q7W56_12615 [Candidatus Latescibacteria bacterium]|nr:hypothetical protein [Candidatus Latescibacterota bacterium]